MQISFKEGVLFKSLAIQTIIFICIFQFTSFIRETSMLSTDSQVTSSQSLPTLHGKEISISADGKPLVVYFFAPWCQVCHASIGNLQAIYEKNQNIDVIAIAMDFTSQEEVEKFTRQHKLTFPIALGDHLTKADFKVQGYPSYYVIDEQNLIASKSMGYSTELGIYLRSL